MTTKGQTETSRPSAVMIVLFIVLLITYLVYIELLNPWSRKALLTNKATITVNVFDCDSGYPINDARVQFLTEEGVLLQDSTTINGSATYSDYPDCFRIKTSYGTDKYEGVCVGSGENRVISLCYNHPEANPRVLYYNDYVGFIGSTSGEAVSIKSFDNVIVSYPLSNSTINYPPLFLYSNLLWSEGAILNLTNINQNMTKSVDLQFIINSKRGTPIIKVYANNKVLYEDNAIEDELVSVTIPKQELTNNITLNIKCNFKGWMFWTTQDCNITNIKTIQEYYLPRKVSQEMNFSTTRLERNAETIKLEFKNSEETISGVKALINNVEVFNSNSLMAGNYSATIPVSKINLKEDNNILRFQANPGAEAFINNIKIIFKTAYTPIKSKEYTFHITNNELNMMNKAVINYYIKDINLNGHIEFNINGVTYISTVSEAGWNSLTIDKEDLMETNKLTINSIDGRFEIEKLKINYE